MTYEIKLQVGSPHVLRDHLRAAVSYFGDGSNIKHTLQDALAQIEEQVKPAVEEPTENFSVISAVVSFDKKPRQLVLLDGYWCDLDANPCGEWSTFTDVEVLRVGIGEPLPTSAAELSRMSVEAHIAKRAAESSPRRFCSLRSDCRMADGHEGACQP